jgi:hypothetical protein
MNIFKILFRRCRIEIEQHGVSVKLSANELHVGVIVQISCFICDAPVRAFVKQVKGHNAYHGCEKCIQRGAWKDKVIFPENKADLRNDQSFDEMADLGHHTGVPSPLPIYPLVW